MIIIAFTRHTSKILPRLVCGKFCHCAPIQSAKRGLVMYQFVRPGKTVKIKLSMRDIKILGAHGWRFVYISGDIPPGFSTDGARTCVDLSKRALGLKTIRIQTPYALYKHLRK